MAVGTSLQVAYRENYSQGGSDWVFAMDKTVGLIGTVKALDKTTKQVLLKFYDNDSGLSEEWWYTCRALLSSKNGPKNPYPLIHEAGLEDLIEVSSHLHRSLASLYARQAVTNLWGIMPTNSIFINYMGSPQNLMNFLKLTLQDASTPLLSERSINISTRSKLARIFPFIIQEASKNMVSKTDSLAKWKKLKVRVNSSMFILIFIAW